MVKQKRRHAFTLVEILVVIGIIAVLAAILLPAVKSVRDTATANTCLNNLRQVTLLVREYAQQNQGRLPHIDASGRNNGSGIWFQQVITLNQFGLREVDYAKWDDRGEVKQGKTFWSCPFVADQQWAETFFLDQSKYRFNVVDEVYFSGVHYALNDFLAAYRQYDAIDRGTSTKPNWTLRDSYGDRSAGREMLVPLAPQLSAVPQNQVLLADGSVIDRSDTSTVMGKVYVMSWTFNEGNNPPFPATAWGAWVPWPIERGAASAQRVTRKGVHGGRVSVSYADGRAESVNRMTPEMFSPSLRGQTW
jgi:prepilin-type N-terminal cleavage/methylation domain-containing protein/prepilin-type processing-associated H-X9-DG protein